MKISISKWLEILFCVSVGIAAITFYEINIFIVSALILLAVVDD